MSNGKIKKIEDLKNAAELILPVTLTALQKIAVDSGFKLEIMPDESQGVGFLEWRLITIDHGKLVSSGHANNPYKIILEVVVILYYSMVLFGTGEANENS